VRLPLPGISPDRQRRGHALVPLFIHVVPAILLASCAQTLGPVQAPSALTVLDDKELDTVTAGAASVDLELAASAVGPKAVTSTQGTITSARTTVLRIAIDPSVPSLAAVKVIGASTADLVLGAGAADAAGGTIAQCSAIPTALGDFAALAQSRATTPSSATCTCSAFAIGLVSH